MYEEMLNEEQIRLIMAVMVIKENIFLFNFVIIKFYMFLIY